MISESEKAMMDVEMAECDLEDGRVESARRHMHRAMDRMDGELTGEVGNAIRAVAARLA